MQQCKIRVLDTPGLPSGRVPFILVEQWERSTDIIHANNSAQESSLANRSPQFWMCYPSLCFVLTLVFTLGLTI